MAMNRHDMLVQARSGDGKTAAFAIAALNLCSLEKAPTQAGGPSIIVLEPTRELAEQTAAEFTRLAKFMPSIKVAVCCGGVPFRRDADVLRPRQKRSNGTLSGRRDWRRTRKSKTENTPLPRIVVGTLGRINRLLEQGVLQTSECKLLVLDEGDQLLLEDDSASSLASPAEQTRAIWEHLPQKSCRIGLFSATTTNDTVRVANSLLRSPILLRVNNDGSGMIPPAIALRYVDLSDVDRTGFGKNTRQRRNIRAHKEDVVCDLLEKVKNCGAAVVFVNTKANSQGLLATLSERGFAATAELAHFRTTQCTLVCTDRYARGIDVQGVGLVINCDLPCDRESFVHRVGRAGRMGRRGLAVTIVAGKADMKKIAEIEKAYEVAFSALDQEHVVGPGEFVKTTFISGEAKGPSLGRSSRWPVCQRHKIQEGNRDLRNGTIPGKSFSLSQTLASQTFVQSQAKSEKAWQQALAFVDTSFATGSFCKRPPRALAKSGAGMENVLCRVHDHIVSNACGGSVAKFVERLCEGGVKMFAGLLKVTTRDEHVDWLHHLANGLERAGWPHPSSLNACGIKFASPLEACFHAMYVSDSVDELTFVEWYRSGAGGGEAGRKVEKWITWLTADDDDDDDDDNKRNDGTKSLLIAAAENDKRLQQLETQIVDMKAQHAAELLEIHAMQKKEMDEMNREIVNLSADLEAISLDCVIALKDLRAETALHAGEAMRAADTAEPEDHETSHANANADADAVADSEEETSSESSSVCSTVRSSDWSSICSSGVSSLSWAPYSAASSVSKVSTQWMFTPYAMMASSATNLQNHQQLNWYKNQSEPHPCIRRRMVPRIGDQLEGKVVEVTEYGIFVKCPALNDTGLVHVSCMNSDDYIKDVGALFAEGDAVTTWFQGYRDGSKLRLTMVNPWDE